MDQNIEYIDARDKNGDAELDNSGTLLVMQPHDIEDWQLGPAKNGDVGMDIPVRIKGMKDPKYGPEIYPSFPGLINYDEGWIDIPAGSHARIPSGLHVKIPNDSWLATRSRSSTGFKIRMDTFYGTIDSGYTGPLLTLVYNPYTFTKRVFCILKRVVCKIVNVISPPTASILEKSLKWGSIRINDGDRLIQIVLIPKYPLNKIIKVNSLPETDRGSSGLGSSGV